VKPRPRRNGNSRCGSGGRAFPAIGALGRFPVDSIHNAGRDARGLASASVVRHSEPGATLGLPPQPNTWAAFPGAIGTAMRRQQSILKVFPGLEILSNVEKGGIAVSTAAEIATQKPACGHPGIARAGRLTPRPRLAYRSDRRALKRN
jgi:hypothetical protein